jgi:two-component system CheB/CheR fusion protein
MPDQNTNGEEAGILAEAIVETIRQPLLILNGDLRVQSANRAFYETFKVGPADTEGRMVYELGNNQWDIPRLRELISEILPQRHTVEAFEVEHAFEAIGEKIMLLSARRLQRSSARSVCFLAQCGRPP